jgi:hypothetical protein
MDTSSAGSHLKKAIADPMAKSSVDLEAHELVRHANALDGHVTRLFAK